MKNITKGVRILNNDLKEPLQDLIYNYAYNNIKLVYCSWKSCAEKLENMGC